MSNNFRVGISQNQGVLFCEGFDHEESLDEIIEALVSQPFITRRMKVLSRPDGFTLYEELGVTFFTNSELLCPIMKNRLRLIRARPNFYVISDNFNVSLENVDRSLYTRRIALKEGYHQKRMDMLAYTPVEYNNLETLAKTYIIPSRQKQFIEEILFNKAPDPRIDIAINTNFAFTGSYTENPF